MNINSCTEKQPCILVAGSFVMDQIAVTDVLPASGQSVLGRSFHKAPGGKGANQAVQAARLGAEVTLFGAVGSDSNGREMLSVCREAGIDIGPVIQRDDVASGCAVILLRELPDGSSENRILIIPGANMAITSADAEGILPLLPKQDMVMLQLEIPLEVDVLIAREAHRLGVPVMLNPAPYAPIPPELFGCVDFISPNETEAESLTGIRIGHEGTDFDRDAALSAARMLREAGARSALITIGSAGAVLLSDNGFFVSPGIAGVKAVDPTAAGDSFIGAFCTAVCRGMNEEDAMRFANHTAAITVAHMGAMPSLPMLDDVLRTM